MLLNHIILAILWLLYCILHSVLASLYVKQMVKKYTGRHYRYYRLFYTVFAAVSLLAIVYYQLFSYSPWLFDPWLFPGLAGLLIAIAGLVIMGICIKKYFLSLSGLKSLFQESPAAELMIAGIHRYMRHPLYLGTFMAIWGGWILFPSLSLLITNVVITGYTLFAIKLEEAKLVAEFGEQYRQYQKSVPKIFPRF